MIRMPLMPNQTICSWSRWSASAPPTHSRPHRCDSKSRQSAIIRRELHHCKAPQCWIISNLVVTTRLWSGKEKWLTRSPKMSTSSKEQKIFLKKYSEEFNRWRVFISI